MTIGESIQFIKGRYVDTKYPFQDRLYFLFGTAGALSAATAFVAAIISQLPFTAALASLFSCCVMMGLMVSSFFMVDISRNRIICGIFLNFFMFPSLFWITGGINCGMVFYFILGLCVAALILDGRLRWVIIGVTLLIDTICLDMGFRYPHLATVLSYEERWLDTICSFGIVAIFIVAVIFIMSREYEKEHHKVLAHAVLLSQQANTDSLTGLYNQRFLMDTLSHLTSQHIKQSAPASLILMDIDDFKQINDTYGHLRGNQVLCRFSALLQECIPEGCTAFRYGGEEFIVVAPGFDLKAALMLAEAIRKTAFVDETLAQLADHSFSISAGVAQYQPDMLSDDWIRHADTHLYTAKQRGKNQSIG